MTKPTYNNVVRSDDWPKPGESFSSRFISNYAQKVQQDYNFFNGGISLSDNMNGAVITMSMTHGVPVLMASPLQSKSIPIGVIPISCDSQPIPNITITTSATINGTNTIAPSGYIFITATYPYKSTVNRISRVRSNSINIVTSTPINVATPQSIVIGPGDYDIRGAIGYKFTSTTSYSELDSMVSKTSATAPSSDVIAAPSGGEFWSQITGPATVPGVNGDDIVISMPSYQTNVLSGESLTLFLVAEALFTVSAPSVFGFLEARLVGPSVAANANVTMFIVGS